jgi:hypothetical protein
MHHGQLSENVILEQPAAGVASGEDARPNAKALAATKVHAAQIANPWSLL